MSFLGPTRTRNAFYSASILRFVNDSAGALEVVKDVTTNIIMRPS